MLFRSAAKDELKEMLTAFINEYTESGWLPRWLSIGECDSHDEGESRHQQQIGRAHV